MWLVKTSLSRGNDMKETVENKESQRPSMGQLPP
ncbi:hypothetical protein FKM82_002090 [Ascaphus truei]